jgi:hypothetical protein
MKLAKIAHYRCDSYENASYVTIPEDMTAERLEELIGLASNKALEAERIAKKAAPLYPDQRTLIQTMPKDTTIAQIEAELEKKKAEYVEWEKLKNQSQRSFYSWLKEVSEGEVIAIHDREFDDFEVECHWGHNHGLSPDYSEEL